MNGDLILDFETEAIMPRPHYPPKPVGFAFKAGALKPAYCRWGHPTGNNSTEQDAWKLLKCLVKDAACIVAHNAPFDRAVMHEKLGLIHDVWHDTMLLGFLADPYGQLGLKPLAAKHLKMPPEERDAVRDWLVQNRVCRPNQKDWGAYISKAPGNVVQPYAIGDVVRTERLWKLWRKLADTDAYMRENALQPAVDQMEADGVRLDIRLLQADHDRLFAVLDAEDARIRRLIRAPDLDLDSDASVAIALEERRQLSKPLPLTEAGAVSVNKHALIACVKSKELLGAMLMRNALATCLRTFMGPWLEQQIDGRLYFKFNQIRSEHGLGARTGRMSTSPNTMNLPSTWETLYATLKQIGFRPAYQLPNMRRYILPDEAQVMIARDYSQQEMRLFAHYEDGQLMQTYNTNPGADAHDLVASISNLTRKAAKTLNFAELYGAGIPVIMQWMDCTESEARAFKRQYNSALPGVKEVKRSIDAALAAGKPVTTIGGRNYYCEEPKYVKGRLRSFEYKMLNYMIQGSAADQTKEAMLAYYNRPDRKGRLLFSVHDEIVISVPRKHAKADSQLLDMCMVQSFAEDLDVPFLTDSEQGDNYAFL